MKSKKKLKIVRQEKISRARLRKLAIKLSKEEKHQVKNIEDIMLDASERYR